MTLAALLPFLIQGGMSLASGLLGKKSSSWSGTKPSMGKYDTLSKDQSKLLKDLVKNPNVKMPNIQKDPMYQQGTGYLQKILSQDPEMMKQFEAPAMRQFNEQVVPGLAEQFAGAGALNSSGFQQTMGQAAGSLSERLAQMRAQLGMDASQQAFSYSQLPFQQAMAGQQLGLNRMNLGLGTKAFGNMEMPGKEGMGTGFGGSMQSGMFAPQGGAGSGFSDMLRGMFSSSNSSNLKPSRIIF
jgi:hypothetical protein